MAEIQWPREIWAAQSDPDDANGRHVFSVHATIPRFEGDSERDCAFHRYVDGDIVDSADRYRREMLTALRARAEAAEAECDRLRAEVDQLREGARRYRWLRSRDLKTIHTGGVFAGKTPENIALNLEDLDRAIDFASHHEDRSDG
ncbi:hypothetical protein JMM63_00630 [Rhodovulum sulfidophilum]|uniref:hypothetical protein n=1 Tax=Rhodovulum sulfidophilum TaxID=35806 RepID=UPI0019224A90|nr:hypothetical protein [Rhodovulum sulfidophilum]MBL3594095.1 hypothetical protein [Rhodovulum sulfidophilum]